MASRKVGTLRRNGKGDAPGMKKKQKQNPPEVRAALGGTTSWKPGTTTKCVGVTRMETWKPTISSPRLLGDTDFTRSLKTAPGRVVWKRTKRPQTETKKTKTSVSKPRTRIILVTKPPATRCGFRFARKRLGWCFSTGPNFRDRPRIRITAAAVPRIGRKRVAKRNPRKSEFENRNRNRNRTRKSRKYRSN